MDKEPKFSRRILKNPIPFAGPFEFLNDFEDGMDNHLADTLYKVFSRILKEQNIDLLDKNTRVLDLGSGNAKLVDYFKKQGVNIVGVDINPKGSRDSPQVLARIEKLPFIDNIFDVLISTQIFDATLYHHDHDHMMREIARVLKRGGIYFGGAEHIDAKPVAGLDLVSDSKQRWRLVYKKS